MKGQANYIDFVVALGIFLLILFIFINFNQSQKNEYLIADEALMISDSLMSEGIPINWTETENFRPGLLSNGSFSTERWTAFNDIMTINSEEVRAKYTLLSHFMIRIGNYTNGVFTPITFNGIEFISSNLTISPNDLNNLNFRRIDRIERAVSYNGTILAMEVVAWQ